MQKQDNAPLPVQKQDTPYIQAKRVRCRLSYRTELAKRKVTKRRQNREAKRARTLERYCRLCRCFRFDPTRDGNFPAEKGRALIDIFGELL